MPHFSSFGKVERTVDLIDAMDDTTLTNFKSSMIQVMNLENEKEFIKWVLRSTHHVMEECNLDEIYCQAQLFVSTKNTTTNNNTFNGLADDIFNMIGSYLAVNDAANLGATNKQNHLKTQTEEYLNKMPATHHLELNPSVVNSILVNGSNPHLYGAPKSITIRKFKSFNYNQYSFWSCSWMHQICKRVSCLKIVGHQSLYNFYLGGMGSLFNGTNNGKIDKIIFGGLFNKSLSLFNEHNDVFRKFKTPAQMECLQISPFYSTCDWTSMIILFHTLNFKHLILSNARASIPKIFHPNLKKLCILDNFTFCRNNGNFEEICKLEEVNIVLHDVKQTICYHIGKLFQVLRKFKLLNTNSVCILSLLDPQDHYIMPENLEHIFKALINIFSNTFGRLEIEIDDNDELYSLLIFLLFVGKYGTLISVDLVVFHVNVQAAMFPLVIDDRWENVQQHPIVVRHDDMQEIRFEVNWEDTTEEMYKSHFLNVIDWMNARFQTYGTSKAIVVLDSRFV